MLDRNLKLSAIGEVKIKKSKPTPTQAPTAVEELPINSSEELDDEMIKEAVLSGFFIK